MLSRSSIDKIGRQLRVGEVDRDALHGLNEFRKSCIPLYEEVRSFCSIYLGLEATGRAQKSTAAIIGKLQRESLRLSQMQDVAGLRVIVRDLVEQDRVVQRASLVSTPVVVDDKRGSPSNGYRAVHLIFQRKGRFVELQVRTRAQHAWAELSEKFADEVGQEIKYGRGDKMVLDFLARLSEWSWKLEVVRRDYVVHLDRGPGAGSSFDFKKRRKSLQEKEVAILAAIRQLFLETRRRSEKHGH